MSELISLSNSHGLLLTPIYSWPSLPRSFTMPFMMRSEVIMKPRVHFSFKSLPHRQRLRLQMLSASPSGFGTQRRTGMSVTRYPPQTCPKMASRRRLGYFSMPIWLFSVQLPTTIPPTGECVAGEVACECGCDFCRELPQRSLLSPLLDSRMIRDEYRHIPELDYCRARAEVLKSFTGHERHIFCTEWFRTRFEAQAVDNILAEISRLEARAKKLSETT